MERIELKNEVDRLLKESLRLKQQVVDAEAVLLGIPVNTAPFVKQLHVLTGLQTKWAQAMSEHYDALMALSAAIVGKKEA